MWNDESELLGGSYAVRDIQDCILVETVNIL